MAFHGKTSAPFTRVCDVTILFVVLYMSRKVKGYYLNCPTPFKKEIVTVINLH